MRRTLAACLALAALAFAWAAPAEAADLENARARQEGNRAVLTYDLISDAPAPVKVQASDDGGKTWNVKLGHLTGDVGEKVAPGKGKTIVWEALRDYPQGISIQALVFELATTGGVLVDPFTGIELVSVKGGTFEMGDTFGDGDSDEKPVHTVTVSDFCMGKYEVTQAQWEKVMGSNPSNFKGADLPVEQVSWDDVQEFMKRLNQKTGRQYRLPTEAEWEYAARSGGKKEKWAGTSSEKELGGYVWYEKNSGKQTQPVGKKKPNGLGLYDMSGNVSEWCSDWYGSYSAGAQRDPQGPIFGRAGSGQAFRSIHVLGTRIFGWALSGRVFRGGCFAFKPNDVRSADRDSLAPVGAGGFLGFRLALSP